MALIPYHSNRRPSATQFGLDVFVEIYRYAEAADVVKQDSSVPQRGDAHPDYPFMFVTDRSFNESGPQATAADIVYMGSMTDDGEGGPLLPPHQHNNGNSVMSASSSRGFSGAVATSPITAQFYAPNVNLGYISYLSSGTDVADDPSGDIELITLTIGDTALSFTGTTQAILDDFFSPLITSTLQSQEVVAGKFWSNTATKTKILSPYIFTLPSGTFVVLAAPGSGYAVSDVLTITGGGGNVVITLTQVGISGSITGWTVDSATATTPQNLITPTGGSGSGALFNIVVVP